MLPIVNRTNVALAGVKSDTESVRADQYVLTVGGERQDDAMRAVIKPVILIEMAGRKASLERDLASYGVTVE